jgi:protein-tyrosine sulfotransferase
MQPLFLLSCERSGSTLLRYILDTHPEICCPGEIALGPLIRALRFTAGRTVGLGGNDELSRTHVRAAIDQLLSPYVESKGKRVWCDKTPANLGYLAEIEWAFPQARYICLYRRSIDVAHSCLEISRNGFMQELIPYVQRRPGNLVAAMMESWIEKTECLVRFERRAANRCRVHYESLVNSPETTLATLFAWLELRWDAKLLERVFTEPHDPGGGDPKILATSRIERDRVGRGDELNPMLLGQLSANYQQRLADLHLELGYPL